MTFVLILRGDEEHQDEGKHCTKATASVKAQGWEELALLACSHQAYLQLS